MRVFAALALIACSAGQPAVASAGALPERQTIRSRFTPLIEDKTLFGCSVDFVALTKEPAGEHVAVDGYLVLSRETRGVAITAMLGVRPLNGGAARAPASAFLLDGRTTNVEDFIKGIPSGKPGYTAFVFHPGEASLRAIAKGAGRGELVFTYDPSPQGVSAGFSVDLTVAEYDPRSRRVTRQKNIGERFKECVGTVLNS